MHREFASFTMPNHETVQNKTGKYVFVLMLFPQNVSSHIISHTQKPGPINLASALISMIIIVIKIPAFPLKIGHVSQLSVCSMLPRSPS